MNIFYLHRDPKICAQMHNDKHVVKMILEYAQLLSTAHHHFDHGSTKIYKPTHENHPCAKWVRANQLHYEWLALLFLKLCDEYTLRYNKEHMTSKLIPHLINPPPGMPMGKFVDPPQCIAIDCQDDDTVEAYRKYYRKYKGHIAQWKTEEPDWYATSNS